MFLQKSSQLHIMLVFLGTLILSILTTGCGKGNGTVLKPLPKKFWEYKKEKKGNIRDGEHEWIRISDYKETEEVWKKYKGVVVVPDEIDGLKVEYCDSNFSCRKYIRKLVFCNWSIRDKKLDIYLPDNAEELVVGGNMEELLIQGFDNLKSLTIQEPCRVKRLCFHDYGRNSYDLLDSKIENLILPDSLEVFNILRIPESVKTLSVGSKTLFGWDLTDYYEDSFRKSGLEADYQKVIDSYVEYCRRECSRNMLESYLKCVEVLRKISVIRRQ